MSDLGGATWRRMFPLDVVLLLVATLATATVAALVTGNGEFVFYIGVLVILCAAVALVHRRVEFSPGLLRALAWWSVLHMAGGLVELPATWPIEGPHRVLYSLWLIPGWLKYDQVVHAYGFGITAWAFWQGLRSMYGAAVQPTTGPLLVCAAAAIGFGALNEIVEFAAVLFLPRTNVGGYINTGWDLVFNALGAIIAVVMIAWTAPAAPSSRSARADDRRRAVS